jgi:sodium/hydrogen exchanger-like protein 6/7
MKDGQWFQAIDQKYLLPLFSNSVASRKHEEKKIARLAARDAATRSEFDLSGTGADDSTSAFGSGGGRRHFFSVEEDGDAGAYPSERDAEVVDEEDDDHQAPVFDATTFASGRNSTSGRTTPTRRTLSRDDGALH